MDSSDEINGTTVERAKRLEGELDTAYLFSYAFFMFLSGIVAERVDLRLYLSLGMILSGLFAALFGAAYYWGIHNFSYFILVQVSLCDISPLPLTLTSCIDIGRRLSIHWLARRCNSGRQLVWPRQEGLNHGHLELAHVNRQHPRLPLGRRLRRGVLGPELHRARGHHRRLRRSPLVHVDPQARGRRAQPGLCGRPPA